jgi:hypothetical protein
MPRQRRIEYPGAIYHVLSRGDRREDIFHDARNGRGNERETEAAAPVSICSPWFDSLWGAPWNSFRSPFQQDVRAVCLVFRTWR